MKLHTNLIKNEYSNVSVGSYKNIAAQHNVELPVVAMMSNSLGFCLFEQVGVRTSTFGCYMLLFGRNHCAICIL